MGTAMGSTEDRSSTCYIVKRLIGKKRSANRIYIGSNELHLVTTKYRYTHLCLLIENLYSVRL